MKLLKFLTIPLGFIVMTLALVLPAHASTPPTVQGARPGAISFAASPTRVVIPETPAVHSFPVTLINTTHGPITLRSSIHQLFQSSGNNKAAVLSGGTPLPGSGANWITVSPSTVAMTSYGQHATATVTIDVPARHAPGQKYLSVAWAPVINAKIHGSGATVSAGLNTPEILLNVSGKVIFRPAYSLSAPLFSGGGPIGMHYGVNNHASNVYALNNGQVVLNGHSVVAHIPGTLLLAGSTTGQHITWQSPPTFGIDQHLTAYDNGKPVASATVWLIMPLWPIVGALAVIAGLLICYRLGGRGKRRERKALRKSNVALAAGHDQR
jgi:hypothetical protein